MKRFFLFLTICIMLSFSNSAFASHYYGSDISYTCLGGNQYEVKVRFYSDCGSGGMGSSMVLAANSSCATNQNIFLSLTTTQATDVTAVCPTAQTSCNGGSGSFGIEMYEYTGTTTLAACADWVIDYNSCCRNNSATNLNFPTTQGHYVYTLLDNVNQPCNSSPQIAAAPDMIACAGDTLYTSANAFDPDGDSLVYSLTDCFDNSMTTNVTYSTGFSGTAPFTGSISIDAQTGLITLAPTVAHAGYICVMIEEYRNGSKINETVKDYLIQVQNCTNTIPKVHQINGGNIAFNSQLTATAGVPITIDFYIYDVEVQAGTQTLTAALQNTLPNSTTNFNAATSTYSVTWTPTISDVGINFINVLFEDNNCPFLGQSQFSVQVNVLAIPFVTAVDDAFFGYENTPITGNVLTNDLSSNPLTLITTPISTPANGTITMTPNGDVNYVPASGFVGVDFFEYATCDINALCDTATAYLNVQPAPIIDAMNDTFDVVMNNILIGNLLSNDNTNVAVSITSSTTPNGTLTLDPNGSFSYQSTTSTANVTDNFTYTICNGSGQFCDSAMVYINILPSSYTIIDTIVLGESYPMYYCLSDSAYYVSDTLNNAVLTFVNDSCFALYGDYLGTDTVTLASANEVVNFYITVENGVWPGDTDDDALVNNVDLLNIGLAYGTVGVPRSQQSILWNGYLADDWTMTFPNGLNAKHADTDGNGIVDANDTMAIIQNWGLTYNKNGGRNGSPIYLETDSMTILNDSLAYIPIMLGTIQQPVSNIYGLAFTITYNSMLVNDNSVMVHFDPSWLGVNNLDMISISKDFYNNQLTEVAVTRIDGNNISGNGQVGRMYFTIQDDIIRGVDSLFTFEITNITAIDNNNVPIDLQGEERAIHWENILDIANNTQKVDLSTYVNIYPNPATDYLTILAKAIKIESIEIFDMTGRKVLSEYSWNNANQLEISELNEGVYIVHIKTDLGVWNEKITILR